ncbi:MAG: ABC transporter permease, partial [Bdellovibrionales bacterium]|nr:ABC transporter permease [Bdellovibrionales bacterium]
MKKRIQVLKTFIVKEILQVLRDSRMRLVLFVAPLAQLTIFGIALSTETRNVKLAISAPPHDTVISDFYQKALGTKWFVPAEISGSDPFAWIQSGQADVVLIASIDGNTQAQMATSIAKVQVLINAQNSTRAMAIESYLKSIESKLFSQG